MKHLFLVFHLLCLFVALASCSKDESGSTREASISPPATTTSQSKKEGGITVTLKEGMKGQQIPLPAYKDMVPPVVSNGAPAIIKPAVDMADQASRQPLSPVKIITSQTPMMRAKDRTQAMEEMLRARKLAEDAAAKK